MQPTGRLIDVEDEWKTYMFYIALESQHSELVLREVGEVEG